MFGRSTGAASALLLLVVTSVVAGCGNDGTGEALAEPTEYGTCDRRASTHDCLEIKAAASTLLDEKADCTGSGTWTDGTLSCPDDTDLIGCCSYEANADQYRACSYTGHEGDPKAKCESEVHGYWQPPGF